MNGPRTNQFVAPTSFITSISRRREKIESRIVFAISSADEISRTTVATANAVESTRATVTTRSDTSSPSLIFSTPAGRAGAQVLADRLHVRAVVGRDLERVRERVAGQVLDDLGLQLAHPVERLGLGDPGDFLDERIRFSFRRTALICCSVAGLAQVDSVQK